MTKAIHLYGAVLLLLAGQAVIVARQEVIGFEERKAAKDFNVCVEAQKIWVDDSDEIGRAVHFCNGGLESD